MTALFVIYILPRLFIIAQQRTLVQIPCHPERSEESPEICTDATLTTIIKSIQDMRIRGNYYIYIVTNKNKTVLYTGVTNNLERRLSEHYINSKPFRHSSFAGRYNACYLIYYEHFTQIKIAIQREKEIKGWRRSKKEELINAFNPGWEFLNEKI